MFGELQIVPRGPVQGAVAEEAGRAGRARVWVCLSLCHSDLHWVSRPPTAGTWGCRNGVPG